MDFLLQLTFHHSIFCESSTTKIWISLVPSFTFVSNSDETQKFIRSILQLPCKNGF